MEWNIRSIEKDENKSRSLYPEKLSLKSEGEIKTFSDKNWQNLLLESHSARNILNFFWHKENYIGQRLGSIYSKEECVRRNKRR